MINETCEDKAGKDDITSEGEPADRQTHSTERGRQGKLKRERGREREKDMEKDNERGRDGDRGEPNTR